MAGMKPYGFSQHPALLWNVFGDVRERIWLKYPMLSTGDEFFRILPQVSPPNWVREEIVVRIGWHPGDRSPEVK